VSVTTCVLLEARRLPTTAAWQQAIDELAAGMVLEPDGDIGEDTGYWPVEADGAPCGFELYRDDLVGLGAEHLVSQVGGRDLAVVLVTHGDLAELRCALLAAVALARAAGGVIVDEDLEVWPIDAVEAEARAIVV
jgi:hypothetical protein